MNKRPSRHKGIWIVAAAVVIAVVTFVAALLPGDSSGPLSGALGVIATPVRSGLSSLAGWLEDRYN